MRREIQKNSSKARHAGRIYKITTFYQMGHRAITMHFKHRAFQK